MNVICSWFLYSNHLCQFYPTNIYWALARKEEFRKSWEAACLPCCSRYSECPCLHPNIPVFWIGYWLLPKSICDSLCLGDFSGCRSLCIYRLESCWASVPESSLQPVTGGSWGVDTTTSPHLRWDTSEFVLLTLPEVPRKSESQFPAASWAKAKPRLTPIFLSSPYPRRCFLGLPSKETCCNQSFVSGSALERR